MLPLNIKSELLNEYGLLYKCFEALSLLGDTKMSFKRKALKVFLCVTVFAIYVDYLCMCIINWETYFYYTGTYFPHIIPNSLSFLTFCVFVNRKEKITQVLQLLRVKKEVNSANKKFLFIILLDAFHSTTYITISLQNTFFLRWYAYQFEKSVSLKYYIAPVRFYLQAFLNPFFVQLVSLLYCELCRRCAAILENNCFTAESLLNRVISKNDIIYLIHSRRKAVNVISIFQNTFSIIITFMIFASVGCCFSMMSYILNYAKDIHYSAIYESIFYFFVPLMNVLFIIEYASAVPREMERMCEIFSKITETEYFEEISIRNSNMARIFLREPKVILSAAELFYFTRKVSLSIIGGMLTYSLLLLNFLFNKK